MAQLSTTMNPACTRSALVPRLISWFLRSITLFVWGRPALARSQGIPMAVAAQSSSGALSAYMHTILFLPRKCLRASWGFVIRGVY